MMIVQFAILTISDRSSKGIRVDQSGPALSSDIQNTGWRVMATTLVPDEYEDIRNALIQWCLNDEIHVILTTGGTGFAMRDITPEVTKAVIEKETPGLPEAMRNAGMTITPYSMLSRSVAGIRGKTLIINLPGSPKAALENFAVIKPVLVHAVELIRGDPHAEQGHLSTGRKGGPF